MALFSSWKHSKRISQAEAKLEELLGRMDVVEDDVHRILEARKKDRARDMARLRWEPKSAPADPGPLGNGIGADPVSQRIRAKRDSRRASLADLAAMPARKDEEEE